VYDEFSSPGYSLSDYAEKWMNPNGLGEMARRIPAASAVGS
jgi:hypothetical protein